VFASWTAYGVLALGAAAMLTATLIVISAFGGISGETVDPSGSARERARVVAEGVSEGLNCEALSFIAILVAVLWLLFCTWRWHWAARPPVVKGDPPYR
jgi:hypothetical protein